MKIVMLICAFFSTTLAFAEVTAESSSELSCLTNLRAVLNATSDKAKNYHQCHKMMNGKDETTEGDHLSVYAFDHNKPIYDWLSLYIGSTNYGGNVPLADSEEVRKTLGGSAEDLKLSCAEDGSFVAEVKNRFRYQLLLQPKKISVSYENQAADADHKLSFEASCAN